MRGACRRGAGVVCFALALSALGAQPASATFHRMMVREVYPGSIAHPTSEYVELQMWSADQNFVAGHSIGVYNGSGVAVGTATFAQDAGEGANQSTLVAATPAAESEFGGFVADAELPPDLLNPAGGAVCWESLDCVAWGSFTGSTPSPAGPPAAAGGIPDGIALRRAIEPGCATLLEPGDDSDNSAVDFSAVFPSPRPNPVTPFEHACSSQTGGGGAQAGGGSGAGPGSMRPQTRIRKHPGHRTRDRTPTFRFTSDVPGSTYLCKLDRRSFKRCQSPFTARQLGFGRHVFKVKARAPGGAADRSPDTYAFTVVGRKRL